MKALILKNWYKISMAFSALIFSLGFLIFSVRNNSAHAGIPKSPSTKEGDSNKQWVVGVGNNIYLVTYNNIALNKWEFEKIGPK